jgi:hypothetical protein
VETNEPSVIQVEQASYTQKGRLYFITTSVTDACGNVGNSTTIVQVLHDKNSDSAEDTGERYDATQAYSPPLTNATADK